MGWTSYHATNYDKKGRVDRIKEVEYELNSDGEKYVWKCLKSSLVGSTVYSAVERINKETQERIVFASVFLTSTDSKDYYNFSYKDMTESMGPYKYDCPISILKLLTPTDNETSLEWRKKCYAQKEKNKSNAELSKLPIGTKIEVETKYDLTYTKKGDIIELTKIKTWSNKNIWTNGRYKMTSKLINQMGYKIITE